MNREQSFELLRIFHYNIPSASLPTCYNNIVVSLHHLCDSSIPATLMMILVVYRKAVISVTYFRVMVNLRTHYVFLIILFNGMRK